MSWCIVNKQTTSLHLHLHPVWRVEYSNTQLYVVYIVSISARELWYMAYGTLLETLIGVLQDGKYVLQQTSNTHGPLL